MSFWVYKKYLEWELGLVLQEFSRNYVQLVNYIDLCNEVLSLVMWSLVIRWVCQPHRTAFPKAD